MERLVSSGEHFTTFNYNGKDSSDFGIASISNGGRYSLNIEPDFSDSTMTVPGYDGSYYYGTQIPGQSFGFNCFANGLTINEYDALRSWLNPRTGGRLILADQPYKYYLVKIESVSKLNALPLSNSQTINLFGDNDRNLEETVYTGDFSINFKTVGSSYGTALSYYRDDLLYDTGLFYDSGLLYKDMSPSLIYSILSNANNSILTIYNPGTAYNKPILKMNVGIGTLGTNTFIKVENTDMGTICYVDVSGFNNEILIDFESQTVTHDGKSYYGRIYGQSLAVSPKQNTLEIPESHDVLIENDEIETHNTIYVENNIVYIDPAYLTVNSDYIGRYFCINNNGGAKILSADINNNTLTIDSTIKGGVGTYDILRPTENTPAGFACNYFECNNVLPASGTLGQVIVVNGIWYIWMYEEWIKTSLFSAKSDFYDESEQYETKYVLFGAVILSLDNIKLSSGTSVSFTKGDTQINGISMGSFSCEAIITPRYL